jgi:hypothetical protein
MALAARDVDGDGMADLIAGTPFEITGGAPASRAGAISVIRGRSDGLTTDGGQFLTFGSVNGLEDNTAQFGWSITTGDVDADGYADVVVGAPLHSYAGAQNAGAVFALRGSAAGLDAATASRLDQNSLTSGNGASSAELFGWSVRCGDYDGDGYDDLAIASPFEDVLGATDVGAVFVLYSDAAGVSLAREEIWVQETTGTGNIGWDDEGFGFGRGP